MRPIVTDDVTSALPTLVQLVEQLADRRTTSEVLVAEALGKIDATQGTLNAFRVVRHAAAMAEARDADRRLASGERLPLLGVPIAIKDDVDMAGEPTAFGCAGEFPPADADCEAVRRLRAAGAVIVGKTNSSELGQWPFTEGPAFGATRNPWHLDHSAGGSSGGSAAAVAAGLVPAAVGSDGAGSVRIPAAWNHLVGIKPQTGRVPTWPHPELFNGLTVIGPIARTVEDAALLFDVLAGTGETYATAVKTTPERLRIGLSFRIPYSIAPARLHPQIRAAVGGLAGALTALGHRVVTAEPRYGAMGLAFLPRSLTGVYEWSQRVPERRLLDKRTRENGRTGWLLSGPALKMARAADAPLRRQLGSIFADVDVVLTPTTALPPTRIGMFDGLNNFHTDRLMVGACPYTWPWNVLGWPGVNVPAGRTNGGLPIGAQLLGPADSEPLLLSVAAELQRSRRWETVKPPA
ncbi:amidase [Fodinicola feengrottensis]|uniref:amidase n=1 Tax=Fodinicola feengrottensis TaxID=435914 RepID=A0ABN2HIZ0_9ACTN